MDCTKEGETELKTIKSILFVFICYAKKSHIPWFESLKPDGFYLAVDVVFIVDCTKGGETELKTIKSFIKRSISNLQISTAGDHVAIVTYGGTAETKFHLKK